MGRHDTTTHIGDRRSGFVGWPLVAALLRAGYPVRAATRHPVPFPKAVETAIISDLKGSIDRVPILQGVDSIVHLVGLAHGSVMNEAYSEFELINRIGTHPLVLAAINASIARSIYISWVQA